MVFAGRLSDGVWGEIALFPLGMVEAARGDGEAGPEVYGRDQRFTPLIGRVRGLAVSLDAEGMLGVRRSADPRVEPVNTVRDVIDSLSRGAETAWVRWEPESAAVVLERGRTVGKRKSPLSAQVVFSGDLSLSPISWHLHLERPYHHDLLGLVRVTALEVTLEASPDGAPRSERMSTSLSLAGAKFSAAQRLIYTSFVPCAGPTHP